MCQYLSLLNLCRIVVSVFYLNNKINDRVRGVGEEIVITCDLFRVFFYGAAAQRAMASSFFRFREHTQRRITVGRTPLDE